MYIYLYTKLLTNPVVCPKEDCCYLEKTTDLDFHGMFPRMSKDQKYLTPQINRWNREDREEYHFLGSYEMFWSIHDGVNINMLANT